MSPHTTTRWSDRVSQRSLTMTSSTIRELLKLTADPAIISFAGGLPAPEVFPVEAIAEASCRVIREHGALALQYSPTEGYLPLREWLARDMARYGIEVEPSNVLITSGSQQALDLLGKVFLNPGDRVLTEDPTYMGALQAWAAYGPQYVTVPIDDEGMQVDLLEEALRAGPKFLYVLPNFQNPGGVTLCTGRRRRIVELASRYGVPIVEDDPYGRLRYEGEHKPPIVVLDAEYHGCAHGEGQFRGDVIYLGTFSKTLAPGLRIGWVVAPGEVIRRLVQMKQGADLHTSTFNQVVAHEVVKGGMLDAHVRKIRRVYDERRLAMLDALARHMPEGVTWTRPHGGMFLWVTLPSAIDATALLEDALAAKVAFVPGQSFFPAKTSVSNFRLNFSYCDPARIEEGIARLGGVVARRLAAESAPV